MINFGGKEMFLGLFKRKEDNVFVSTEIFKKEILELKTRLDLTEDDIKRLRKKSPSLQEKTAAEDEEIIKSIEDDGFKEIRELQKKYGNTK